MDDLFHDCHWFDESYWFDGNPDWIVFQWHSEAPHILPDERKCFQCGHLHFIRPENPAEDSWVECEKCRERIVSFAELHKRIDTAQERHIRRVLQAE